MARDGMIEFYFCHGLRGRPWVCGRRTQNAELYAINAVCLFTVK